MTGSMRDEVKGVEPTPAVWKARGYCLKCGLCCRDTEMVLTPSDLRRIEALGYVKREFTVFRRGFYRLRNVDGKCFFYRDGKCIIYEYRPLGCSMYPIVIEVENCEVTVDELCPLARETKREELAKAREFIKRVLEELRLTY